MTFTEAALEVLRRAGKPLHYKEIANEAIAAGLLSHVGQTPEATMGARLLSMARREHDRRVTATDSGVFALAEWGLDHAPAAVEKSHLEEEQPAEGEPSYRPKERHPSIREEYAVGARRDERRRGRAEEEEGGAKKKRYPPPAEVAHQWLREHGHTATLADVAHALRGEDKIAEALERDLHSFERALQEENRRRTDSSRPPLFQFESEGRITALELPKEGPREKPQRPERPARREEVRPATLEEQRRNTIRSVRRRIGSLDPSSLERAVTAFLEATGYRELNMTRRSKEGPLYLARHKWGAGELRYAVRVLKPGRDLGRQEVQELRRDLAHYSAQLGLLIGTAECTREAKSEANAPGGVPVMLYGGEALAEAFVDAGLGVTKRLVEWVEYDEEFFLSVGGEVLPAVAEVEPAEQPAAAEPAESRDDRNRRGRERRRDRRPREDGGEEAPAQLELGATLVEVGPAVEPAPESAPAETTPAESAPTEPTSEPAPAESAQGDSSVAPS